MTKITVTLGIVDGKPVVLNDPTLDPESQIKFVEKLTNSNGVIKTGKTGTKQASEAMVVHNTHGTLRRRKFK